MKVAIYAHPEFDRQIKHYKKKYHSLLSDYRYFLTSLKQNPFQGSSLGRGIRKVRFGVADKGGGKSGGMRIMTFNIEQKDNHLNVYLVTIYDKSEYSNVSDKYIDQIINLVVII